MAQIAPGVRGFALSDRLRTATGHHTTAFVATFRPQINDPVGGFNYFQVVFDDNHRVALIAQTMQHSKQALDVFQVQAGGWFVKHIKRLAGAAFTQLAR